MNHRRDCVLFYNFDSFPLAQVCDSPLSSEVDCDRISFMCQENFSFVSVLMVYEKV